MKAFSTVREDVLLGTPAPAAPKKDSASSNGKKSEQTGTGESEPLSVFIKAPPAKTQGESVAVLTVWANLKDGTSEFTKETIEALWKKAGLKKSGIFTRRFSMP